MNKMGTSSPINSELLPVASIRRRCAAMLYESLLVLGLLAGAFMLPHLLLGLGFGVTAPGALLFVHVVTVLGVYFVWCWSHGGQTLAMKTWKLCLTTPDAVPPSSTALIVRYLLAWPSLLFYGAGLVWALFDRDRQFLHDRIAGTRIVRVPDAAQSVSAVPPATTRPILPGGR